MRYLIIMITLIIAGTAQADTPKTPRGLVIAHECESIDPASAGFTCRFTTNSILFVLHEDIDSMAADRRKEVDYEYYRMALRFFELGGHSFEVRSDYWPKNKVRTCGRIKGKPYYEWHCRDAVATK